MTIKASSIELVPTPFNVTVTANQQFTGTEYLFEPELTVPIAFVQMELKKGADAGMTWTLAIHRKVANDDVTLVSGATEQNLVYTWDTGVFLAPGDFMKLTTTAATSAMKSRLWFRAVHGSRGI